MSGIVLEVDGHAFHERTKEQATRDKARDRLLQSRGYKVFRFTGSDVWKDAFGCAAIAISEVMSAVMLADHVRDLLAAGDTDGAMKCLERGRL